ncbi:MAG: Rpn family recombination-promoting nuclease/putative transposase [Clostridiales Family XIII bacterium]|nr:Rpn family recombination-promoting nuclease/putative transposase [Clostridiales Family XIII bacterium]
MSNKTHRELLHLKNDYVFKRVFGDTHNIDILTDFLKSILDIPEEEYERIEIIDPALNPRYEGDKKGILDVRIHTTNGKTVNVELQLEPTDGFRARILFYSARLLSDQTERGKGYDVIKRVISVVITDFDLITETEGYHSKFLMYDKDAGIVFSDIIEIQILELAKLPEADGNGKLLDWLKLIRSEDENEMEELAKKNPYMQKTVAVIREMSEDEAARMFAEAREKERRDRQATYTLGLKEGRQEGEQRGMEIGEQRGIEIGEQKIGIAIAKSMKRKGMDVASISEITGLGVAEIGAL